MMKMGRGPANFQGEHLQDLAESLTSFSGERRLSHYWCFKISINMDEELANNLPKTSFKHNKLFLLGSSEN